MLVQRVRDGMLDVGQNQPLEAFGYHWGECKQVIVVQTTYIILGKGTMVVDLRHLGTTK